MTHPLTPGHAPKTPRSCRRLLRFLPLFFLASGCSSIHRGVQQVGNWGPATFLEDGRQVTLYTAQMAEYHGPFLIHISRLGSCSEILMENPTPFPGGKVDDEDARLLWYSAPPWRREENLRAVAQRLTAGIPRRIERFLISAHDPVVIGLSDTHDRTEDEFPEDARTGYLRFLMPAGGSNFRARQLMHPVRRIVVCPDWPAPDAGLGPVENRRIMAIDPPLTVEQVMDRRPWESPL